MTGPESQHIVLASLFAAGVLDAVNALAVGQAPSLRQGLGLTVAGVVLSAASGSAPALAAGFAVLVLLSSLFTSGLFSLAHIRKALG